MSNVKPSGLITRSHAAPTAPGFDDGRRSRQLKILFCGNAPIVRYLGASKVLIELADEMSDLGWSTEIIGPDTFGTPASKYPLALREFLVRYADRYDVVDYDHEVLPFARSDFSPSPLFVARSVLLAHHQAKIPMPRLPGLRPIVGGLVYGRRRRAELLHRIDRAHRTIDQADLVNVSNDHDRAELIQRGIAPEKVTVLPFGMSASRRKLFDRVTGVVPEEPKVSFVGTFDQRKGARDFPAIVDAISRAVGETRFVLLGTRGLLRTADDVRRQFPRHLRSRLEIHEQFDPEALPQLLSDCSVGIFPSYIEGFGFGVLEMLAASIPVIAYDAPGPPMMLPPDWLVPRGNAKALGARVVSLLQDPERLAPQRHRARELSRRFSWPAIARSTSEAYVTALCSHRGHHGSPVKSA